MEYTVSVVRTCPERSGRGPSAGCGLELSATMVREYLHSSRTRVSAPHQPPFSDNLSSPNESNTCWNFGGSFSVLEDTRPRFLVIVRLLEEAFMEVGKNNHDGLHPIHAQQNTISAQQVVKARP